MGIDPKDFSLKNQQKLLFVAKMLFNNKYGESLKHEDFMESLFDAFANQKRLPSFNSVFLEALENFDEYKKEEAEALVELRKEEAVLSEKEKVFVSEDEFNSTDIQAKMEILNYFSSSLKEKAKTE